MAGDPLVGYAVTLRVGDPVELVDLQRIAVRPDHRRRGLARSLLTAALADAAGSGADRMLEVSADNPGALAFYAAAGFTEIDRRRGYYRDGADARGDAAAARRDRRSQGLPSRSRPPARTGQRGRLWFCRVQSAAHLSFPEEGCAAVPPADDLARRLADVAEQLLAQQRLGPTVRDIAAHAVDAGEPGAGVSVLAPRGRAAASWPTDDPPECDALQLALGEGPCFGVSAERLLVSGDVAADPRWRRWGPRAASTTSPR